MPAACPTLHHPLTFATATDHTHPDPARARPRTYGMHVVSACPTMGPSHGATAHLSQPPFSATFLSHLSQHKRHTCAPRLHPVTSGAAAWSATVDKVSDVLAALVTVSGVLAGLPAADKSPEPAVSLVHPLYHPTIQESTLRGGHGKATRQEHPINAWEVHVSIALPGTGPRRAGERCRGIRATCWAFLLEIPPLLPLSP